MGTKTAVKFKHEIEVEDFPKVCRTCTSRSLLEDISKVSNIDGVKLTDLMDKYLQLESTWDDRMPQNICNNCVIEIFKLYVFREQCLHYDRIFKKKLEEKAVLKFDASEFINENIIEVVEVVYDDDDKDNDDDLVQLSSQDNFDVKEEQENNPKPTNKTYDCPKCSKPFAKSALLKRHELTHTGAKPFCCAICGKRFLLKHHVKKHMNVHKNDELYKDIGDMVVRIDGETKMESFNSPKVKCKNCSKFFLKSEIDEHIKTHDVIKERPYVCEFCGDRFRKLMNLKWHRYRHTGETPYSCGICGKKFNRPTALKRHILIHRYKRKKEKVFECEACNKTFSRYDDLKNHEKEHKLEKPFLCHTCGKGFGTSDLRKAHEQLHEPKKFQCNYCGKAFARSVALKSHIRTHTKEKPHKCQYCEKGFTDRASLRTHIQRHRGERPYKCNVCNKGFTINVQLKSHMLTHTGEKPFECPICGKRFRYKAGLRYHKRTHTGETPFMCDYCSRGFYDMYVRKRHIRRQHPEVDVDEKTGPRIKIISYDVEPDGTCIKLN